MKKYNFDKFYKGKKILITGGLGFIGSNLAVRLARTGCHIALIDSMVPDSGANHFNISEIKDSVTVNLSDIRDSRAMESAVRGIDIMFNCAGQVSHIDSMRDPHTDLEINAKSQLSVLEACRKKNPKIKIVFASTRQIYGKPRYLPVDEDHPLNPTDINGVNKLAAEWYHILYYKVYGIKSVCLRMTNTYGPRLLMKHNRQGFIGWFVRRAIDDEEIEVFGDGKQLRDPNYIDDVTEAMLISGSDDSLNGQIFNLGNDQTISLGDIAGLLVRIRGGGKCRFVPFPEESKKIDIGHYYASYGKFNKATGWRPRVSHEDGFKRMIDYYMKNKKYYWTGK